MKIIASCPHFFVSDLIKSVRFYVDVLGFEEPKLWGDPPGFAMPQRDGFTVMLNQIEERPPSPNGNLEYDWDAYFWVDEIEQFYGSIKDRCDVVYGPTPKPYYGMQEMALRDPDGYLLVFAAELKPNPAPPTSAR